MKKYIFLFLLFLVLFPVASSPAQVAREPVQQLNGVVTSIVRGEFSISQRSSAGFIYTYTLRITARTRINGTVTRGALVAVVCHRQFLGRDFVFVADEVTVLAPVNPYYPHRY